MAGYAKKKKRKQNRLAMLAITLVVTAMLTVLGYQTVQLQQKSDQYTAQLEALQENRAEQESRAAELEKRRISSQSMQFVIEEAKKLGLVFPNEI